MPLKKGGQDQSCPSSNDNETNKDTNEAGEFDPDDEDCDEEDDDWINDIGLHSNLRTKL